MPSDLSKEASHVSTDLGEAVQIVKEFKERIWTELGVQVSHDELYTTMVLGVAGLIQHERARKTKIKPQAVAKVEPTTEKSTVRIDPITDARRHPRTPPIPSSRDSVAPRRSKPRKPKAVAAKKVKKTRVPSKPRKAAKGRRR